MFLMYFGNYLLNKGYISREKFKEVIKAVETSRPRIGVIALHLGYLKSEDIERITREQHRQNKKFGEIAIELGLLTQQQLEEILSQQPGEFLALSQVLIDQGIFSYQELERIMNEFKEQNQLSDNVLDYLKNNDSKMIVESFIEKDKKLPDEIKEYLVVFLNSCIRFLTRNLMIYSADDINNFEPFRIVHQRIKGDININTYIIFPEKESTETFVKKYSQVADELISEILDDSIAEYLNLVNGLAVVNYSEKGLNCELEPPVLLDRTEYPEKQITSKIETDFGCFYISQMVI
ncbi:MAG: hypothetical protein N2Z58_08980 [Fervidobacterium sp.]|nr:hypothetical protein [Fervidobacterium sp.]